MSKVIKKPNIVDNKLNFRNTVAILFLFFSFLFFISFISYLYNWQIDQSTLEKVFDKEIKAENAFGKVGNWLGDFFINSGVGIMAFVLPITFFILGIRNLLGIKIVPFGRFLNFSIFGMIWVPLFLNFIIPKYQVLSGAMGSEVNAYLVALFGYIGLGITLGASLLVFVLISFKLDFRSYVEGFSSNNLVEDEVENAKEEKIGVEKIEGKVVLTKNISKEYEKEDKQDDFSIEIVPPKIDKTIDDIEIILEEKIINHNEEDDENGLDLELEKIQEENLIGESDHNKILKEHGEYDPFLDLPNYQFPKLSLLKEYPHNTQEINKEELEKNKNTIVETLGNYSIKIAHIKATIGPTVTLYEIIPEAGVRISKIKNLEDDIALSLAALGIRIIAPIPGKGTIGIEVPNSNPSMVSMRSVVASEKFQKVEMELPIALGKTISNETFITDLAKMPHLLMAGATGQGKSVGLNAIITSLLYKKHPSELKFVFVDPKKVELTLYNKIERHFLAKIEDSEDAIITDNDKVINTLNSLCIEMDDRYELLKNAYVRNIKEYNVKFKSRKLNPEKGHRYLPYIVLVIDEFADLIMTAGKEVELPIARLAQLARAIGIHLIIATQRPSVNVITGMIKANFPARLAFRVTSKIDSRTILDSSGADQLIGKGDMLLNTGNNLIRIQCAFVDTPEIDEITEFIGSQKGYSEALILPEFLGDESKALDVDLDERDALFEDAAKVMVATQQGSASMLQRKLKLGYNRAGRIVDQLEAAGVVGPFEGSKARQVLIQDEVSLERLLNSMNNE